MSNTNQSLAELSQEELLEAAQTAYGILSPILTTLQAVDDKLFEIIHDPDILLSTNNMLENIQEALDEIDTIIGNINITVFNHFIGSLKNKDES